MRALPFVSRTFHTDEGELGVGMYICFRRGEVGVSHCD